MSSNLTFLDMHLTEILGLLFTLLAALVGGVWNMSAKLTNIQNLLQRGDARMNRHEKLLGSHSRRLNKIDGETDPISED